MMSKGNVQYCNIEKYPGLFEENQGTKETRFLILPYLFLFVQRHIHRITILLQPVSNNNIKDRHDTNEKLSESESSFMHVLRMYFLGTALTPGKRRHVARNRQCQSYFVPCSRNLYCFLDCITFCKKGTSTVEG